MKIAYHHRTRGFGAEGVHIRSIVESLRRLGCQVDLLSLTATAPGTAPLPPSRPRTGMRRRFHGWLEAAFPIIYNIPGTLYLGFRLLRGRYDVIYERYAIYNLAGWAASRLSGTPLILEVNSPYAHETAEYTPALFPRLARAVERFLLGRADVVLTVSHVQGEYLASLGASPDRVHVMPNGVDFDRFDHHVAGDRVRRDLGLVDRKVVGFIGSLRLTHGLDMIFEAIRSIDDDRLAFLVVGEGRDRRAIETAVADQGLDCVVFTGAVPHHEAPEYIAAMDIAVKPTSNFYCCPLKILEYMAMKVPVIAGHSPSVAEVIEDGVTGRLVDADPAAFESAILDLARNPERGESMATAALDSIRGRSWVAIGERIMDIAGSCGSRERGE